MVEIGIIATAFYRVNRHLSFIERLTKCSKIHDSTLTRYKAFPNLVNKIAEDNHVEKYKVTLGMIMNELMAANLECADTLNKSLDEINNGK